MLYGDLERHGVQCMLGRLLLCASALMVFAAAAAGGTIHGPAYRNAALKSSAGETQTAAALETNYAEKPWMGVISRLVDRTSVDVRYVYRNSPAATAGIRVGDRITAINGQSFADQSEFEQVLESATRPAFTVTVSRGGLSRTLLLPFSVEPQPGSVEYERLAEETRAFLQTLSSRTNSATER